MSDDADPRHGRTHEQMRALPPDDPDRRADVLLYLTEGAGFGLGQYEWDTIKAALRLPAPAP